MIESKILPTKEVTRLKRDLIDLFDEVSDEDIIVQKSLDLRIINIIKYVAEIETHLCTLYGTNQMKKFYEECRYETK